jgi:sirohydrochlorin cobaltochelatase
MKRLALSLLLLLFALQSVALAQEPAKSKQQWAVVLAVFGSSKPEGMAGVDKVRSRVEASLPGVPVRVGLTSRHAIMSLKAPGVLTAMAQLGDEGYRNILIQPLHVSAGAEYEDLRALTAALNSLVKTGGKKPPFAKVVLGDTALGRSRSGDAVSVAETAGALSGDVLEAKNNGAALVYASHGNPKWPAQEVKTFQETMTRTYPGVVVLAGTLESKPGIADVQAGLKKRGVKKVLLLPLLFGAGVHASEDLCGPEKDSWKSVLEKSGYSVDCRLRGLGEVDAFADMLAARARAAMEKAR